MKRLLLISILLGGFFFQSCDKQLDLAPENVLIEDKVFEEAGSAELAMAGLYRKVIDANGSGFGKAYSLGDMTTNIMDLDASRSDMMFVTGEIPVDNSLSEESWKNYYSAINVANVFIDKVPKIAKYADDIKEKHIGEAKFIRAYCYLCLLQLFGDGALTGNDEGMCVPLQLAPYEGLNIDLYIPRDSNAKVYKQIIDDFKDAVKFLPNAHDNYQNSVARATKDAAYALLSRVYLYMNNYTKVLEMVDKVISGGRHSLEDVAVRYKKVEADNFGVFSEDYIWSLELFGNGGNWQFGSNNLVDYENITLASSFMNEYLLGDTRKDYLIYEDEAKNLFRSLKYSEPDKHDNVSIIRYSEIILNKAEALANTGLNQTSVDLVNSIRTHAGLSGNKLYSLADFTTKQNLLEAIWLERKLEFACEGRQRYDLIRTGRNLKDINLPKNRFVLPIPQSEIIITEGVLKQNLGYK